jgi:hypothetical protein
VSKRIIYIHNYHNVTFKDLSQWHSTMSGYVYKALRTKNGDSIRNWKIYFVDFNGFMLDAMKKPNSETNQNDLYSEESAGKFSQDDCDDDDSFEDDKCDDDDKDKVGKCDVNDEDSVGIHDDGDVDTVDICDKIEDDYDNDVDTVDICAKIEDDYDNDVDTVDICDKIEEDGDDDVDTVDICDKIEEDEDDDVDTVDICDKIEENDDDNADTVDISDKSDENKCIDDDVDTFDICDKIEENDDKNADAVDICDKIDENKCMSSIRRREDEIRYYYMCEGYGEYLKAKLIGNQKWGSMENQQTVRKLEGSVSYCELYNRNRDTIDASHITIEQKELIGGGHKERIGHILCINGKFIGDKMIDNIYEFVNNHGMIHREQVFINAKHGYISYVSTMKETVFSYSNGKTKIPAVTLPPIVESLMKHVQEEIMEAQYEYVKGRSECTDNIYRMVFNGVQVQVGPGFGNHLDRSPDTCYPDPDYNHSRDRNFPHVNEMQVVTIGFVFDKNGKLAGSVNAGCCEVVWSIKDKEDQWRELSKIVTGQIFLHLQMHNIQSRCEHHVKPKQYRSANNYVRVVLSFRYTLFARYEGDPYIRFSNILDSTTSKSEIRVPFQAVAKLSSISTLDVSPPLEPKPHSKMCVTTTNRYIHCLHCGTLTTPKDVAHYAHCPEVCRILVGSGTSMEIAYKDKTIGNVPHYNELGTIGTSILSSQLRNYADIKSSSHHVNIASNDFGCLRDLVLEQAYKNSGKEIQSILNSVVGKSCEEIRSYYNSKSELEQEIWVGPSGGSLVKAGWTPLGMKQKEDTDAIAKTPSCINPNASEQRFIDAVRYRAVVVLHAPERWIDDIKSKHRSCNVVNLGLFYFYSCVIKTHENLSATNNGKTFSQYYGEEGMWTFEQNPIYVLTAFQLLAQY